jgi:anti-sigma factor RsiW
MIDQDLQLKLLSCLDGELSAAEAADIKNRLAADAEARALFDELRNTKAALAGNETAPALPESREFFWSKIELEIGRQNRPARATPKISWLEWVQRHLIPVSGTALLACLLGLAALNYGGAKAAEFGETELVSNEMGANTYRDQQNEATMVWIYDRSADSEFTDAASLASVAPK